MRTSSIAAVLTGIWLSLLNQAVAFQSDYISVQVTGRGPDIVLIHGFACSPEVWSNLVTEIGPEFRIHLVRIAGFAGSAPPKDVPESYLKTLAAEIARYMDEEKLKQPKLIGHSMGGLLSLLVASKENSKASGVIVVDAIPFFSLIYNPRATSEQVLPQAKAMETRLAGLDDEAFKKQAKSSVSNLTKSDEKKALLLKWSVESDRKVYAKVLREVMTCDARPELKTIKCPVTVLYAYDEAMDVSETQLKNLYATAYTNLANVNIKSIPDSFHFVMWDQPKEFNRSVKEIIVPASR